jgi:hypothetical protein
MQRIPPKLRFLQEPHDVTIPEDGIRHYLAWKSVGTRSLAGRR